MSKISLFLSFDTGPGLERSRVRFRAVIGLATHWTAECVGGVNSQRTPGTNEISTSESDPKVNLVSPWGNEVSTSERR